MEILNITGVLKTQELKITKSVASLIIATTKSPDTIVNENITIWIERVNGSNVYICQSAKLIDFLMLTNYGADAIQSTKTGLLTVALCELSKDGAVQLNEGESLKIKMESLTSTATYIINAVEDPLTTNDLYIFDRKTVGSEELIKSIDVTKVDLCVIDMHPTIKEISLKYDNGMLVKHTPFELRTMSRDIDPVFYIADDGAVSQGHSQKISVPLVGVTAIEFVKDAGAVIEITTRTGKNLLELEN